MRSQAKHARGARLFSLQAQVSDMKMGQEVPGGGGGGGGVQDQLQVRQQLCLDATHPHVEIEGTIEVRIGYAVPEHWVGRPVWETHKTLAE